MRLLKIRTCADCRFCSGKVEWGHVSSKNLRCMANSESLDTYPIIPESCPLPKAVEEQGEEKCNHERVKRTSFEKGQIRYCVDCGEKLELQWCNSEDFGEPLNLNFLSIFQKVNK